MPNRKVTYRLHPNAGQAARLLEMLGLHQRLYNTALEERIRVYKATSKGLSFADQCKALTQWRKNSAGLRSMNAQSGQVTLKRLDMAFRDSRACAAIRAGATRPMATAGNCTPAGAENTAGCICRAWD